MAVSNPTGQPEQDKRVVRIWDDPESRIHFLETMLKNKEWEAVVYHPDFAPDGHLLADAPTPLPELAEKLAARGYKTSLGQDENGIPILNVRNFGSDTSLSRSIRELGFTKGVTHKLTHIGEPLGKTVSKVGDLMKFVLTDKARLIGTAYLVGDAFLAASGGSGQKDPLKGLAGKLAAAQSLIFMAFAKEGSEAMFDELTKTARNAEKQGKNLLDASAWQDEGKKRNGPIGFGHDLLKKYPLQIGAWTQVAGQAAFFAAGARNMAAGGNKAGAMGDMATAVSSAAGWLLMMRQSKEVPEEQKAEWNNPKRVWQEVQAHPSKFAAGLLSVASVTGIVGGVLDRNPDKEMQHTTPEGRDGKPPTKFDAAKAKLGDLYANSNKPQVLAYGTYFIGDALVAVTNSGHYGAEGMNNADMLASAAEEFIKASSMVLGKEQQAQFVGHLSNYMAENATKEAAKKEKRQVRDGEAEELGKRINANLTAKLPPVHEQTNKVAAQIANVVGAFHPQLAGHLTDRLCEAVCGVTGVAIEKDELKAHVTRQIEHAPDAAERELTVSKIEKPLAGLVKLLPGAANAESVDRLFSVVGDFVRPEPLKGRKDDAPVVGSHTAALVSNRQQSQEKPVGLG